MNTLSFRVADTAAYRADIDGLRGVAVLAVIGYHVFPDWVRAGYVGVDVFFVISGYLISSIILNGLDADRFTFGGFYARRIRRIFPALIVLLALCYLWGWFVLFADDYRQFARHMAGSAAFVANFFLWHDIWYFDGAVDRKPLVHLWSLGIEEQFYLVWPLLLYLAWKRRLNPIWPTAVVLAASFLASAYIVRHDASAAFYSPFTRVWELALGAVLACAVRRTTRWPPAWPPRAADLEALAGLALVLTSVFSVGQTKAYLGLRTALPTLGAALMIHAGSNAIVNRQLLSRPWLVSVGLISYPLYLWHWPLLSFTTIVQARSPSNTERAVAIAASVLLAWATYRLIERPIRFGPRRPLTVPALCALLIVVAVTGAATYWRDGLPDRRLNLSDQARFIQYYQRMNAQGLAKAYQQGCDFMDWGSHRTRTAIDPECTQRGERATALLWGDSYAQALSLGIRQLLRPDVRLAQVATSACPPSEKNLNDPGDERCSRSNLRALAAIAELKPGIVVLAQMKLHHLTDWASLARRIRAAGGQRVLLVGPTPQWQPSLPLVITTHHWNQTITRVKTALDPTPFAIDAALQQRFKASSDVEYISIIERLCDADGCVAALPGGGLQDLIVIDAGHLSPKGSAFVVDQILGPTLTAF